MRLLFISVLCSMAVASLDAQEPAAASQPTPPYLAAVPANCHWIVSFSYISKSAPVTTGAAPSTPASAGPSDSPLTVETTKVGKVRRIVVKLVNGITLQFDFIGNRYFAQGPLGLEYRTLGELPPYKFFSLGFLFTQGVNLGSFKDQTTYQGVPAFHYRDDSTEAWIAVDTRLPVGADSIGAVKTTYQFLQTPDANAIVLTPAELKILENQKKAENFYNNMR